MPYVTVPRDLSKVKNKLAMGMTKRQLMGIAAAGAVSLPVYFLLRPLGDLALYLAVLPAVPFFLLGFYRAPDGRPLEVVVRNYVQVRYKQPRVRPYQTGNIYEKLAILQQIEEVFESESKLNQSDESDSDGANQYDSENQTN